MARRQQGPGRQLCWLAIGWAALGIGAVHAGETETRIYSVRVDGKPAGEGQISIDRRDDGTTVVTGETNVKVRVLFFKYTYWYHGREVWKNGRLHKFDSSSDDNGAKYTVSATAEPAGLRVTVNGQTRVVRNEVWPTSYWQLPPAKRRNESLLLLDADTGRDLDAHLQRLGEQLISVDGREQKAEHYRLTGKVTVDLWFDEADRMVHQDWVEDGHRTTIELARIHK